MAEGGPRLPLELLERIFELMEVGTLEEADRLASVSPLFRDLVNRKFKLEIGIPFKKREKILANYPHLQIHTLYYNIGNNLTYLEDPSFFFQSKDWDGLNFSSLTSFRFHRDLKEKFIRDQIRLEEDNQDLTEDIGYFAEKNILSALSTKNFSLDELQILLDWQNFEILDEVNLYRDIRTCHVYVTNYTDELIDLFNRLMPQLIEKCRRLKELYVYNIGNDEPYDLKCDSLEILEIRHRKPYDEIEFEFKFQLPKLRVLRFINKNGQMAEKIFPPGQKKPKKVHYHLANGLDNIGVIEILD